MPPARKPARPLATTKEVADYLGVPEATVKSWRLNAGAGPKYITVGKHVRYDWADVEAWVEAKKSADRKSAA